MPRSEPTPSALRAAFCWERVDRVPNEPDTTAFKRRARYHQACWREGQGLSLGTHPIRPSPSNPGRPLGSRLVWAEALSTEANFLSPAAAHAAAARCAQSARQPFQTLSVARLYADLLSSMPLCFNVFGPLWADVDRATAALRSCWPDTPGRVSEVRFEWSPGRRLRGRYLENQSAFDVAFVLDLPGGGRGVFAVETKYHEHWVKPAPLSPLASARLCAVSDRAAVFVPEASLPLSRAPFAQLWQDHLLALSMAQDPVEPYAWVRFALLSPRRNPNISRGVAQYSALLRDPRSFVSVSLEDVLARFPYTPAERAALHARDVW